MEEKNPVENCPTDTRIGKFENTEQLLAAYNALESEFTKRCQLIKELQSELSAVKAQAEDNADSEKSREADARSSVRVRDMLDRDADKVCDNADENEKRSEHGDETTHDEDNAGSVQPPAIDPEELRRRSIARALEILAENAEECAELIAEIPTVASACIARYKQKLIGMGAVGSPSGLAVLAPVKRPHTLSDAKRLADEMLK